MTDDTILRNVGPQSVDSGGELVKKVGVHNQASRLIKAVARSKPAAVIAAQARPEDIFRTQFLVDQEVIDATVEAFGKENVKADGEFYGRVRGKGAPEEKLQVVVLFTTPSGRTARGVLAYAADGAFDESRSSFDDAVKRGAFNPFVDSEDPKALREELAAARKEVRRLQGHVKAPAAPRAADGETRSAHDQVNDVPGGAADDADALADKNVKDIKKALPDLSEEQLDALEAAEKDGKNRPTVIDAISDQRDALADADADAS